MRFISQKKYNIGLIKETRMLFCETTDTLIDPDHNFEEAKEDAVADCGTHQCLVVKLIILSHIRRYSLAKCRKPAHEVS